MQPFMLRASSTNPAHWQEARERIYKFAGRDFLAASRGEDFSWFSRPHERQATEILCGFLDVRNSELRVRRAEALVRALGLMIADEVATDAQIKAEHRCGPRKLHRADIYARVITNTRTLVVVIEAKFDHRARNPWRSYESLAEEAVDWHGFIVAPTRTREIRNVIAKRRREWSFLSWRKLLREMDRQLSDIDDADFRRFRATLLRRSEGIAP
jgi:hypothetical protein